MIKTVIAGLLTLLLCGCLAALDGVPTPEPAAVPPAPAAAALPAGEPGMVLSLPEVAAAASSPVSPSAPGVMGAATDGTELSPEVPIGDHGAGDQTTELLAADEDASESEAADPETIEEKAVLADADQAVPENEGVTVPADEVTFDFPVVENEKVRYYIDYFNGPGREVFGRWLSRAGRYLPVMQPIFAEEGIPQDLAYLAMIESGFNNRAYSWAHAAGPWQFIEGTGRIMGLKGDWWYDERRDFEKSTRAAARYLRELNVQLGGDWYLTLASYNAGPGRILKAIEKGNSRDFWDLTHGNLLQPETKTYVPKLLAAVIIAKQPEKYGFTSVEVLPPLAFETVMIPTATDLEIVARLCGIDYDEIKRLNPELKRWCTPPALRNYSLRVPQGLGEKFLAGYSQIPPNERANYQHHRIKSGDTLLAIAKKYGIRVADIHTLNTIKNPRSLKIGTDLILPLRKGLSGPSRQELADDYVRTKRPGTIYTVKSGDNLGKVARRFGISQSDLRTRNRLSSKSVLRVGQTLVISASAANKNTDAKPISRQAKVLSGPTRKITYRVRAGDTLWGISRQFDVATSQIIGWNNLGDDPVLQPGDTLTLLVQSGRRG